jgi:hypothetical protein
VRRGWAKLALFDFVRSFSSFQLSAASRQLLSCANEEIGWRVWGTASADAGIDWVWRRVVGRLILDFLADRDTSVWEVFEFSG